nr:unnamed protein product [Callosobruchus chinensis]
MEKNRTPLTRKKSLRKSSIIASGTKKVQKTPQAPKAHNTPLKKHIQHPRNRSLDPQKFGETDKENSSELINSVNLHNTFDTQTPKTTEKQSSSTVHFDQTADEAYKKISTDSDIEFSNKMRQRKKMKVETNNTGNDLNNRKSVRFMPTKTVIHPHMNVSPEEPEKIKPAYESYLEARKCGERKSTPFVKRSKSSVITIDSTTTTESDVSESSESHPVTPTAAPKSFTTPMKSSTQKDGLSLGGMSTFKCTENVAEVTPFMRSTAQDRPKRKTWSPQKYSYYNLGTPYPASKSSATPMKLSIQRDGLSSANKSTGKSTKKKTVKSTPYGRPSAHDGHKKKTRSPLKYSCVNLVTPDLSKTEHSLRREGTFLVESPSIVVLGDTKPKIQDSFNDSKAGSNSTKRQRRKWDKSAGINISGCNIFGNPSEDKDWAEAQKKNWNQLCVDACYSMIEITPLEGPPPSQDDFLKKFNEDRVNFSSTPLHTHKSKIPAEVLHPDNLLKAKILKKQVAKVPNFAEIHQRNFQKMENIKDLAERKAKRAALLLSGQKPPAPVVTSSKGSNTRKHLNYSPKMQSVPSVSMNVLNADNKLTAVKLSSKPIVKKVEGSKVDRKIVRPAKRRSLENEKNGFTRFGFKVGQEGVKKVSKDEQVKAVATKTKVGTATTDKRRILTQNVRTNRRFELLMQMRNKNK